MLGLGLGSHKASALRSLAAKLLAKLRERSTYYENNQDSKNTIQELDNYELLDKATILLTPTATSDARVHSVKTYTGDELVTNGTFDTDSDWSEQLNVNFSVTNGVATIQATQANSLIYQNLNTNISSTLRVEIDVVSFTGAHYTVQFGGSSHALTDTGKVVFYTKETRSNNKLDLSPLPNETLVVNSVSVVDVSSDFDFDRASSATRINSDGLVQDMQSITDPELVLNGDFEELGDELTPASDFSTSDFEAGSSVSESNGTLTFNNSTTSGTQVQLKNRSISDNNTYKITFTLSNFTSGTFRMSVGNQLTDTINYNDSGAEGTHTFYVEKINGLNRNYFYTSGTSVVASNISVKEVDPNNRWSFSASGDSSALITDKLTLTCDDGDFVGGSQSYSFVDGNTYRVSFDLTGGNQSKAFTFRDDGSALGGLTEDISLDFEGTETKTFIFTANANSNSIYIKRLSPGTYSWSIDNISLKDITFSTDVDLARINYDSSGDNGHILLEPTSTNLLTYSEDFTEILTQSNTVLVTSNQAISPDGTLNADKLIPASGNVQSNGGRYYEFSSTGGTDYSVSIFVKQAEYRYVTFTYGSANAYGFHFDLQDGVILQNINNVSYTSIGREVESFGNGWYRLKISLTDNSTVANRFISVRPANEIPTATNNNYSTTGDGTSGIYAWGFQFEALSYATSYIPNHGTAVGVTRAAETLTGSGNSTLINTAEGTLYLESKLLNTTGTKVFSLGAGTNNADPAVLVGYAGSNMYFDFIDTASLVDSPDIRSISGINTDSYNKMAVSYTSTSVTVFLNGVKKVTKSGVDFTPSNNLKALYAGYGLGSKFEGEVKEVTVFNEALTDDELELLTGVTNYSSFGALAAADGYTII
jgi:hypothetical protein